jgi:hypothetical protein
MMPDNTVGACMLAEHKGVAYKQPYNLNMIPIAVRVLGREQRVIFTRYHKYLTKHPVLQYLVLRIWPS